MYESLLHVAADHASSVFAFVSLAALFAYWRAHLYQRRRNESGLVIVGMFEVDIDAAQSLFKTGMPADSVVGESYLNESECPSTVFALASGTSDRYRLRFNYPKLPAEAVKILRIYCDISIAVGLKSQLVRDIEFPSDQLDCDYMFRFRETVDHYGRNDRLELHAHSQLVVQLVTEFFDQDESAEEQYCRLLRQVQILRQP